MLNLFGIRHFFPSLMLKSYILCLNQQPQPGRLSQNFSTVPRLPNILFNVLFEELLRRFVL